MRQLDAVGDGLLQRQLSAVQVERYSARLGCRQLPKVAEGCVAKNKIWVLVQGYQFEELL